jgi:hypothetical protein
MNGGMRKMYDIRKGRKNWDGPRQWGREYYSRDGMGMYVPVLFIPYFDWEYNMKTVKTGLLVGEYIDTPFSIIKKGIRDILEDRWRILNKFLKREWYEEFI